MAFNKAEFVFFSLQLPDPAEIFVKKYCSFKKVWTKILRGDSLLNSNENIISEFILEIIDMHRNTKDPHRVYLRSGDPSAKKASGLTTIIILRYLLSL